MPRNMSFAKTTEQIISRTKTVTRRKGWKFLKAGDVVCAVEKGMGLKKGEQIKRYGYIVATSVRREPLNAITDDDVTREGFPTASAEWFVDFFCEEMGGDPDQTVTRIEFEYIDPAIYYSTGEFLPRPKMGAS